MTGAYTDLFRCVLHSQQLHKLSQKLRPTHLKYLFDFHRRCYASRAKSTSLFASNVPQGFKVFVKGSAYMNIHCTHNPALHRLYSARYLASKSGDPNGNSNDNKDTKNNVNKHTNNNKETNRNSTNKPNETTNTNSEFRDEGGGKGGPDNDTKTSSVDEYSKIGFETSVNTNKEDHEDGVKHKEIILKVHTEGRTRMKTDFSKIYTDNIFVPLSRVIPEYLLEKCELEHLAKYTRRSPYPRRDNLTVFKKKHLEKRAIDKWGSLENLQLQKDFLRARQEKQKKQTFSMKQELMSYFDGREAPYSLEKPYLYQPLEEIQRKQESSFYQVSSAKVVLFAIACNSVNCLMKLVAWLYTGSHSMFAEVIHSAADTINQIILMIGIKQSLKEADSSHPYGWAKFRNVSSLISGVGIFCVGSGLSIYHGFSGLLFPGETTSLYWALATLCASFFSEGGTLLMALRELEKGRKKADMSLREYVTRGIDPTTTVVLMEDAAAVLGILIAGACISITQLTGSVIADAVGSLLIGSLLGCVASFIIYTNTAALVGRSIPAEKRLALVTELESDRMIRTLIDVKATEAGGRFVRFKAEVDFDGREVTRFYLEGINVEALYKEMKEVNSVEQAELFMLKHGENVIDTLGSAVDRIETSLKKRHPEIRHCDLEQL